MTEIEEKILKELFLATSTNSPAQSFTNAEIAEKNGVSVESVIEAIMNLEGAGLIELNNLNSFPIVLTAYGYNLASIL